MADVLAVRDAYRAQQWEMVVQECAASGLSNREFCRQRLLEQEVIHAAETVIQVLKEDGKPASSESRMWVYGSGGWICRI